MNQKKIKIHYEVNFILQVYIRSLNINKYRYGIDWENSSIEKRRYTLFVIELNKCCKIRYKIENLIKSEKLKGGKC